MKEEIPHICDDCIFRMLSLKYLTQSEYDELIRFSRKVVYKKGDTIYKQGEKASHVFFLHLGLVKLEFQNPNSKKSTIIGIRKGPTFIGIFNIINNEGNAFSVIAVEDCYLCMIDLNVMSKIFRKHGDYMMDFIKWEAENLQPSIANFVSLAYKNLNGRIAGILLYLQKYIYNDSAFKFNLTRKELAEIAGCSVENVIKTLSLFKKEKIIEFEEKNLKITSMDKLMHIHKVG
jgi:CRP-like cAMP-binding protein